MALRGPQNGPRGAQDGPRSPQDAPSEVQEGPKTAPERSKRPPDRPRPFQDGLRWPQDCPRGPQDGPRGPQEHPRDGLRSHFDSSHFGSSFLLCSSNAFVEEPPVSKASVLADDNATTFAPNRHVASCTPIFVALLASLLHVRRKSLQKGERTSVPGVTLQQALRTLQ